MDTEESTSAETINLQIFVPDYNIQKCLQVNVDDAVFVVKQTILNSLPKDMSDSFNMGFFLPPCNGRAGKFLQEERTFRDYPFQDCVPYLELKYKKRVYKLLNLDEKHLKQLHSKSNLKKFLELVKMNNVEKVEKLCSQGLDPNFHDGKGETPLAHATGLSNAKPMILTLVAGGAHLDFRSLDGRTPLHTACLYGSQENVKTLLDLGASPNCRDPIGLTPLYYSVFRANTDPNITEVLLRDYAELGVTDQHGNQEIHQACKNGLVQHLEHLLFYGAELDCQNVNGNTPLTVCAVNDTESCARVLLFRGADPTALNVQGQTAYHVAIITGHGNIAEMIKNHNPTTAVPYQSFPRFNSKRRLASTVRTPSMGRSKSATPSECNYGSIQRRSRSVVAHSPDLSISTCDGSQTLTPDLRHAMIDNMRRRSVADFDGTRNYANFGGTLRKPPSQPILQPVIQNEVLPFQPNTDVNIPRILVIPRGAKGFGFILRGAKKLDSSVNFEPTPEIPGLQYFEGVDMNGMGMRAGLKPGDFLLEINGEDVRCASHDQVVRLIQLSGDTITLKIVTVDLSQPPTPYYSTMPNRRKSAPAPPRRHPSTSLTLAKGRKMAASLAALDDQSFAGAVGGEPEYFHTTSVTMRPRDKIASVKGRVNSRRISAAELEQLMARQNSNSASDGSPTFSSIDSGYMENGANGTLKPGPKVYASVSEMKRQRVKSSVVSLNGGAAGPVVMRPPSTPMMPPQPTNLKSFTSSPDLVNEPSGKSNKNSLTLSQASRLTHRGSVRLDDSTQSEIADGFDEEVFVAPNQRDVADLSDQLQHKTYSQPVRSALFRPKTPPPPPPPLMPGGLDFSDPVSIPPQPTSMAPPPPPPPPPLPLASEPKVPVSQTNGHYASVKPTLTATTGSKADCRGITAEALTAVKLKSPSNKVENNSSAELRPKPSAQKPHLNGVKSSPALPLSSETVSAVRLKSNDHGKAAIMPPNFFLESQEVGTVSEQSSAGVKVSSGPDFNSDLRSALAKRRNHVDGLPSNTKLPPPVPVKSAPPVVPTKPLPNQGQSESTRVGYSLKESVHNTIGQAKVNGTNSKLPPTGLVKSGSPTNGGGFGHKKESGYSSSRTSLEPSECGDESHVAEAGEILNNNHGDMAAHRVSVLSRQIEENLPLNNKTYGGRANGQKSPMPSTKHPVERDDAISLSSSLSGCSEAMSEGSSGYQRSNSSGLGGQLHSGPPPLPPPDYDDIDEPHDSGTGDSESEDVTPNISQQNIAQMSDRTGFKGRNSSLNPTSVPVTKWSVDDVCHWLDCLYLSEYKRRFAAANVDGQSLLRFDRAAFTRLGVTRIAHRITMENSLKKMKPHSSTAF